MSDATDTLPAPAETAEADPREKAAEQLHKRLLDLAPDLIGVETVAGWTDDERAAVADLIGDPPTKLSGIPAEVVDLLGPADASELVMAATRRKLDNALRRDDRVRKAERRLVKEQRDLRRIDEDLKELKEERTGQEAKVKSAVHTLQEAIKDQSSGQNALPLAEPEPGAMPTLDAREIQADPAATTAIDALKLPGPIEQAFRDAGRATVEQVRKWVQTPEKQRERINGVGPVKVQLVADALTAWVNALPPADG